MTSRPRQAASLELEHHETRHGQWWSANAFHLQTLEMRSVSSKTLFVVSHVDDEGIIVAASRMTSDMETCDATRVQKFPTWAG